MAYVEPTTDRAEPKDLKNVWRLEMDDLRERLAAIEHDRWAGWQEYMHSICVRNADGSLTIPKESVEHWERQIATPYSELSEKEKDSDREQVDRYWPIITQGGQDDVPWDEPSDYSDDAVESLVGAVGVA